MTTQTVTDRTPENRPRIARLNTPVSTQVLYRLAGLAVLIGGVCGALSEALHPADPMGPVGLAAYARVAQWVHVIMLVGVIVLLLGLPAIYLRQSLRAGRSGLVGFVLLFVGLTLLAIPHSAIDILLLPALAQQAPLQLYTILSDGEGDVIAGIFWLLPEPLLVLGALIWAWATLRARVLPAWPAWLLVAAIGLNLCWNLLPIPLEVGWEPGPVLFYLALASFGWAILNDKLAG